MGKAYAVVRCVRVPPVLNQANTTAATGRS
jgi:hypothetical protein